MNDTNSKKRGFTLIELLIVIGIILILAGIVLVVVNPIAQFGKANDTERKSEIGTLLSAIYKYQTSPASKGNLPQCLLGSNPTATAIPECDPDSSGTGVGNGGFEGAVQLGAPAGATTYDCTTALVPNYLSELPVDPDSIYTAAATGYYVCRHTDLATNLPRVYVLSVGSEVYKTDGGCDKVINGTLSPVMCVSG